MWVGPRGMVLQHESTILGAKLLFQRRTDMAAASLANRLDHVKTLFERDKNSGVHPSETN